MKGWLFLGHLLIGITGLAAWDGEDMETLCLPSIRLNFACLGNETFQEYYGAKEACQELEELEQEQVVGTRSLLSLEENLIRSRQRNRFDENRSGDSTSASSEEDSSDSTGTSASASSEENRQASESNSFEENRQASSESGSDSNSFEEDRQANGNGVNVGPPNVGPPNVGPPNVGPPNVGPPMNMDDEELVLCNFMLEFQQQRGCVLSKIGFIHEDGSPNLDGVREYLAGTNLGSLSSGGVDQIVDLCTEEASNSDFIDFFMRIDNVRDPRGVEARFFRLLQMASGPDLECARVVLEEVEFFRCVHDMFERACATFVEEVIEFVGSGASVGQASS